MNWCEIRSCRIAVRKGAPLKTLRSISCPEAECLDQHIAERLHLQVPPRILILYGSVRERSYSRFAAEEASRLLKRMGAEVKLLTPPVYPCQMMYQIHTLKSPNCAAWSNGVTVWCGVPRKGTGNERGYEGTN